MMNDKTNESEQDLGHKFVKIISKHTKLDNDSCHELTVSLMDILSERSSEGQGEARPFNARVRLRKWLEEQQEQALEAVKDSVTGSEEEFFHGCRSMAKDTLKWLDKTAT